MSLTYTTGNPSNLTAGATASMTDISGPFTDIKTWADAKFSTSDLTTATLQTLGMNSGGQVGRGKSIIASTESRTNVAYGTLTTPDQVSGIVLPTDGLIFVAYHATWQESVQSAAAAAIFIGATQLKRATETGAPGVDETSHGATPAATDRPLTTYPYGLSSWAGVSAAYGGDVTTGQVVGSADSTLSSNANNRFGVCGPIFAAAGTYTVSVQFKASSGSVTAKNRRLWVWTLGF